MPSTKHIESRILDFPEPLRPVTALKVGSQPEMTVLWLYDLKLKGHVRCFVMLHKDTMYLPVYDKFNNLHVDCMLPLHESLREQYHYARATCPYETKPTKCLRYLNRKDVN